MKPNHIEIRNGTVENDRMASTANPTILPRVYLLSPAIRGGASKSKIVER